MHSSIVKPQWWSQRRTVEGENRPKCRKLSALLRSNPRYMEKPTPKSQLADSTIRLYRGETNYSGPDLRPEWVKQTQKESGHFDAEGRWWTDSREIAEWYKREAGNDGRVVSIY